MSDAILWLEKDGKRWGLEPTPSVLRWIGADLDVVYCWAERAVALPLGADINDSTEPITRDDAVALVRRLAPAFGYVVRERVVAGAWVCRGGDRFRYVSTGLVASGLSLARVAPAGGWWCWDPIRTGPSASGPETGPAGMAAADAWLTEHAPWVALGGGAYVVPPEPVDEWDEALAAERAAVPPSARRDAVGAMAHAVLGQADRMRLDDVVRRVEALEAARGSAVVVPLSVEPIPFGDGDGFAVLVTLPSGRCLSVDRDSDRCLTVERDMHRKYRTQREVDNAVRYWRGVFGLGVA